MKKVTLNRVCIEKKVQESGRTVCYATPVFESTDMTLAMMVATSCKKFHERVIIQGYSVDGSDYYGVVEV